jgi:small subunit ribosomal protein S9
VTDVEQPDDEQRTPETDAPAEEPVAAEETPVAEAASDASEPAAAAEAPDAPAEEPVAAEETPVAEAASDASEPAAAAEAPAEPAEEPVAEAEPPASGDQPAAEAEAEEELIEETPRVKPEIPGADLVPDIVPEGADALSETSPYDEDHEPAAPVAEREDEADVQPIADAAISLATGARYTATGKRKTAVARVTLKPGTGDYVINGKPLNEFFPRPTLQRNIRQPLETVGYEARMDVVAKLHGGGVSAQAGALRHGISRALL